MMDKTASEGIIDDLDTSAAPVKPIQADENSLKRKGEIIESQSGKQTTKPPAPVSDDNDKNEPPKPKKKKKVALKF
jgi:hypothetical protein